jgi:golgin subfamily B member 1
MLLEVARLFENEVGDLAKAFTALLAGYKEDPQTHVWNELERLASATGMWTELLSELAEIVPTLPELDRAAAWVRIAKLYGDKLGHADYALTSVQEALKLAPDNTEAQEMRITLLRRAERWKDLADALWKRAELEDSPAKKSELFIEQADIYESRLSDGAKAAQCYREALEADASSHDARGALESLLRRRGEWKDLIAVLDDKATHASGEDVLAIKREVAELYAERLSDRKSAIERYAALLSEAPRDLPTLRALERLYQAEGRHEDYLGALAGQAEAVESDRERAALYRRMATEWEEHPGGGERAEECLEKLLAVDPRSEDAFRSLEKLYRADHKWQELIDTYRRHATIVPGPIRGEIFAQVGAVYEQEIKDWPRAIEAFIDADGALPNHAEALVALTRLYEKTAAWEKAVEVLERRAGLAEVKSQKVEHYHRAGELTAEKIGDAKAAEQRLAKALELDAAHVPSMTALVEIYRKNGEFLKAAKLLVEAVPHTHNRLERTRMLVEAGEIFDGLEDRKKATELYLDALAVDPEHVEAGERVAELLWQAERYKDLVPILEMLTRKEADEHVQVERLCRLGRAAQSLEMPDKVLKAYTRAAELEPTHLEAQRALGTIFFEKEDWKSARVALEKVFEHHIDDLPPSERVELFYRLGTCESKEGRKDHAKEWFQRALEVDPTHRPSLLAMMEFGETKPESMIDAKKALLATASSEERVKLLAEIGDLYLDKLEDPVQGVGAYREALELKPDHHKLLHRCLDVYVEQKAWTQALEMLERLISIEKVTSVRAKYRHAAGLICRDELGQTEPAAKLLNEALDDDPTLDRSAEALEELYEQRQDWKELARFYRKSIKRIGPETGDGKNQERLRLWSKLGEVCLDKLGDRASAVAALEVALTFERNNLERHKQLADLYVQAGPEYFDKAIVEHQTLLRAEKNRIISYRSLKHLYIQTSQRDKSAVCSYALTFLKKGEPDDQKHVAELKEKFKTPPQARRALNDETWGRLQHPDEDRFIAALFAIVSPMFGAAQAQPHKALGLNRKEAVDANDPRPFNKALRYVAGTFGVQAPELYARPDQKEAVQFVAAQDKNNLVPVFLVGQPLLADKRPERELVFEVARRLSHLRPERLARLVLPQPAQIAHVIEAAMVLGDQPPEKGSSGPIATGEVGKTAQSMRKALNPGQLEQIAGIGRKLRATGVKSDVAALAWLQANDLTSARAAYAMVGDLETCARLLASEPQSATALPATHRLLDLVWSSCTEDVLAARKHLGTL